MRLLLVLVSCVIYTNCQDQQKTRSPVVFVPGMGGSRIEVKLNKSHVVNHWCSNKSSFYTLWLNLGQVFVFDCFVDNMKLYYDNKTRMISNSEGVDIQIPGWGNPSVVETLDPQQSLFGAYFKNVGDMLVNDLGYIRNVSLRAAPYDFRKGPNENKRFFVELKSLIEEIYLKNNNQRVTLLAHSMGGPMSLIFLQRQSQTWKDKYIFSLITLGSPWGGSMESLKALAMGLDVISLIKPTMFRELLRTFPSIAFLLPSKTFWKDEDLLVQTHWRNYTFAEIQQYLVDIEANDSLEFYKDNGKYLLDFHPPGVELYCIHGAKINTTETILYKNDQSIHDDPTSIYGDGDGTINLRSLEGCNRWTGKQKQIVHHQTFPDVSHVKLLTDENVLSYIKEALSFSKVTVS